MVLHIKGWLIYFFQSLRGGLIERGLIERGLIERDLIERGLIERGLIELIRYFCLGPPL